MAPGWPWRCWFRLGQWWRSRQPGGTKADVLGGGLAVTETANGAGARGMRRQLCSVAMAAALLGLGLVRLCLQAREAAACAFGVEDTHGGAERGVERGRETEATF